jgi:hypothetical protein
VRCHALASIAYAAATETTDEVKEVNTSDDDDEHRAIRALD